MHNSENKPKTPGKDPLVSIIILNYNGLEFLERCIDSVARTRYPNFEIIVVDNASNDASIATIEGKSSAKSDLTIVKNDFNMGFAEGNNIGARHARGDLLVFLNNDTEVPANWLDDLVTTAIDHNAAGIVLPRVISQASPYGDLVGNVDWLGNGVLIDMEAPPPDRTHFCRGARELYCRDSEFETIAAGPAFMIKRKVWDQIGGFDPKYFIYAEDIDLSWRARLMGHKTIVSKSSFVSHKIAGTMRRSGLTERRYLTYRNTLRTLIKDYSTSSLLRVIAPFYVVRVGEALALLISTRNPKIIASIVRATRWNIRNFTDSWSLHILIQAKRTISESEIRGVMARLSIAGLSSVPIPMKHRPHLDSPITPTPSKTNSASRSQVTQGSTEKSFWKDKTVLVTGFRVMKHVPHRVSGSLTNLRMMMRKSFFSGNHMGIGSHERGIHHRVYH